MEGELLKVFINILDFLEKKELWLVSDFNGNLARLFLWYFGHNFFLFSDSELKFLTRKSICRKLINYLHIFFSHAFHFQVNPLLPKKIPWGLKLVDKSQNQGRRNRWSPWSPGFTGIQRFYFRKMFSVLDIWRGKFFMLHRKKARSDAPGLKTLSWSSKLALWK